MQGRFGGDHGLTWTCTHLCGPRSVECGVKVRLQPLACIQAHNQKLTFTAVVCEPYPPVAEGAVMVWYDVVGSLPPLLNVLPPTTGRSACWVCVVSCGRW